MNRWQAKNIEEDFLKKEKIKFPELFNDISIVEDDSFLSRFGIHIPGKEKFPKIFLKYVPEDFIVEEILSDGQICSIYNNGEPKEIDNQNAKHIQATLVKRGLRTTEAIDIIIELLKCSDHQVKYMGLKDEDAITAQKISFTNIPYKSILEIKSELFFLKDIEPIKEPLTIGKNKGNRFTITIRKVGCEKPNLLPKLGENKFYNYFYTQRFLPPRFANFYWGLLLIKGEFTESLKNFLCFNSGYEQKYFEIKRAEAEKHFGSWSRMREVFIECPIYFDREIKVLDYLIQKPNDIVGGLKSIPEQIRLWIYTISSWFFNHKISELIQDNGPVPKVLPTYTSDLPEDWQVYKDFATRLDIFPFDYKVLKLFPFVIVRHNDIQTIGNAYVHSIEEFDRHIKIVFDLDTGAYATTFLSHFFNIISGYMPDSFSKEMFSQGHNILK